MKSSPLVSVIIPCYNYGKYLAESIESAIYQTYKNIEIIVIDDGSTDNTREIVDEYKKVKYIYQTNKGIIETRNRCLKEANGKYLIMLDADDFLNENYVEETVKIAESNDRDIVYTNVKTFGLENDRTDFSDFSIEELKNRNYIHTSSLIRTQVAKKYKFDNNLEKRTHEDWDFFLNMCLSRASAELCKSTLLNYRIHGGGRNNRAETDEGRINYVKTYLYILSKYEEETKHLSGKLIGEWYIAKHKNLKNHQRALRYSEEQRLKLINEKNRLINSRSYKLYRKIYNFKNILTRPFAKK